VTDVAQDSTPESAFHRAIFDRPGDSLPVLIFADWLDERGDPRGPYLRRSPEIYRVIARLRTAGVETAERVALLGPADSDRKEFLRGLILTLTAHRWESNFNPRVPGIIDATLERLANQWPADNVLIALAESPGAENVREFVRRAATERPLPADQTLAAATLATNQDPEDLLAALDHAGDDLRLLELFACLAHELVLYGRDLTDRPAVGRIQSKLHSLLHPLAPLPLALTKLESTLGPARRTIWEILPEGGGEHAASDTSPDERSRLLSAFAEYDSAAAWTFHVPQKAAKWTCGLLRAVAPPLAAETRWRALETEPAAVYHQMFSAAARDGYEGATRTGPYSRALAWRSLTAAVGLPAETDLAAAEAGTKKCKWCSVEGHWTDRGPGQVALGCLHPCGMSGSVILLSAVP
jgi:uncharacterized protein (TIGR02996 family)